MIGYLISSGLLSAAAMVGVAGWELLRVPGPPQAGAGRRWATNLSLYALEFLLRAPLAPLVTLAMQRLSEGSPLSLRSAPLPLWLRIILELLLLDAAAYAAHVVSHHIPWLWRLHAVHHSDRALDVTTAVRHHPLEQIPVTLMVGGCGALLGLSPWDVLVYSTLAFAVQLVAHAELRLPPSLMRVAGLVFVTPSMHYLHHSRLEHETNSNYGEAFSIWDRLFGTFALRPADTAAEPIALGLDTYAANRFHTLSGALLQPLARPDGAPAPAAPRT